ncbi:p53-mediated apoptosis protein EI24/PIG8 [Phaffia rhodozyma]|uniref:p53-mediated apoptosis protein EI24/PIG8 n=1 Tax=Phaffia rhodozyma TaxID=264483 RepID=A0A0F7SIZ6_PHARH|nr:p53-mediated apoptosis protein EI24/PIG8 [Phaffia rhodozyma]
MIRRRPNAPPPNSVPLYPTGPSTAAPKPTYSSNRTPAYLSNPSEGSSYPYRSNGGQSAGFGYSSSSSISHSDRNGVARAAELSSRWMLRGLRDGTNVVKGWEMVISDARLRGSLVKTLLLNIPLLLLLLFISHIVHPLVFPSISQRATKSDPTVFSWMFNNAQFWQMAGTGAVVLVNGAWQSQIAERAWGLNGGGGAGVGGRRGGRGEGLATRSILLLDYLLITSILRILPGGLGWLLSLVYTTWVNGWYCFEYTWSAQGWSFVEKIDFVQTRWAYFFGFGLPITFLTCLPFLPPLLNATIFALLYPFYLILSTISNPVPLSTSSLPMSAGGGLGGMEEGAGGGGAIGERFEDELGSDMGWWPRRIWVLEAGKAGVRLWDVGRRVGLSKLADVANSGR